ncbi:MAG TPA: DUF4129 domain-containing protein [Candidatus Binatia bacterium]|nr:DUF4129 domain-containing protein [Candidatus Binatia bacterium]
MSSGGGGRSSARDDRVAPLRRWGGGAGAAILVVAAGLVFLAALGARGSQGASLAVGATAGAVEAGVDILAGAVGGAALVVTLALFFEGGRMRRGLGTRPPRRSLWSQFAFLLTWSAVLAAIAWWVGEQRSGSGHSVSRAAPPSRLLPGQLSAAAGSTASPPWALIGLVTGIAVMAVVMIVLVLLSRPGRVSAAPLAETQPTALEAVDAATDALAVEADPRRAVIAAYAVMERMLGAAGSPRRISDAPTEHLERSLVLLGASRSAARRLTELFERARFSLQVIDESVRRAALDALAAVRRDLEPA